MEEINSHLFQMNLDEDEIYIQITELDEIWNFIVNIFFIWDHLGAQIYILTSWILKVKLSKILDDLR